MRIGIDARTLSGRFTGDRTYWRGLIGGLSEIDKENEYFLYTRLPVDGDPPATGANFTWKQVPSPTNDALWMQFAFPQALKRDRIDVGHTQYNIPLLGAPCPIVTTIGDISFKLFPELFLRKDREILNRFMPLSFKRAAHIIAVSESTRRDILRNYKSIVPPEKVTATLLAVGNKFSPPADGQEFARKMANDLIEIDTDDHYILAVGVLQPRKNLISLLDAFALMKLGSKSTPHKLVIVGKRGWKNQALDDKWESLPEPVRKDIVFAGYVADEHLPTLYGGADVFCYPSLYEGFGLPVLEAMACGCPVICARNSSLPEVVGDAGVLLAPTDSEAWARALEKIIASEQVQQRWRERGLEQAAEFSWTKTAELTLSVYKNLL
jgi:glycosyltransferase involved in cell wall biosynthesis